MKDNSINNAGVLFFAEKMDPFFLHSQTMLLAFKDYEGVTIFDRKEVRGDLISQFNEADFFLKKHMSLQGVIQGTKRRNVYEVPQEAWREAIANAIIHRDYRMSGTSMQVRVFPNRIEIISPGRLPEGITPENVGDISSRRNEIIADMFARLDVIEKAGTGILRIRKAMREEGLKPPVFETKADFFKVILYRPHGTQPSEARDAKSQTKKTKIKTTQESAADKILDLIKERPKITKKEIAEALGGITPDGVKYHLNKLVAGGKIKRIGHTKNAHWEVCS
jgi:ATP-dependent DNA helicase RecG